MKEKEYLDLVKKLGINELAAKNHFKLDKDAALKQVEEVAKFMGLI